MFGGSDRARLNSHRQSDRQCRPRRVRQFLTCPPCRWRILLHPGGFRSDQEPFRFALQSKLGGACQKRGVVPRCTCGCARGVPAEPGDEVRRGVGKLQCTTLKWSSTFGPSPFTLYLQCTKRPQARERYCARMGVAGATRPRPCRRSADGAKILSRHEARHEVCHEASHEVLRNLCFFTEVWLMNRELSGHDV